MTALVGQGSCNPRTTAAAMQRTGRSSASRTECGLRGRTGRVQRQARQAAFIDDDDDAARDDDAGANDQGRGRRGRPKYPVDGEGPKDCGVFKKVRRPRRSAPKRIGQPHLTERSGDADSDQPDPTSEPSTDANRRSPVSRWPCRPAAGTRTPWTGSNCCGPWFAPSGRSASSKSSPEPRRMPR